MTLNLMTLNLMTLNLMTLYLRTQGDGPINKETAKTDVGFLKKLKLILFLWKSHYLVLPKEKHSTR